MAQDSRQNKTSFSLVDFAFVVMVLSLLTLMAILYTPPSGVLSPTEYAKRALVTDAPLSRKRTFDSLDCSYLSVLKAVQGSDL